MPTYNYKGHVSSLVKSQINAQKSYFMDVIIH